MSNLKYEKDVENFINKLKETYGEDIQLTDEVLKLMTAKAMELTTKELFNSEVEMVSDVDLDNVDWDNVTFESINEEDIDD